MYRSRRLQKIASFCNFFVCFGSGLQSLFLLYMRLTWGHQFFLTGLTKLQHISETAAFFTALSVPWPLFNAYLVGWVEAVGGLLLILGLASRLISLPLITIVLVALTTAHAPNLNHFRFILEPLALVRETPYPFLITTLLVFTFGPGKISIDGWLKRWAQNQPQI